MSYPIKSLTKPSLDSLSDNSLVRLRTLTEEKIVPFSVATVWRKCKEGSFPSPIKISDQITAWRLGEIRAWAEDPSNYQAGKAGGAK